MSADRAREILGVPWMNRDEAAQAIPPAYTRFVGEQLMAYLRSTLRTAPVDAQDGPDRVQDDRP